MTIPMLDVRQIQTERYGVKTTTEEREALVAQYSPWGDQTTVAENVRRIVSDVNRVEKAVSCMVAVLAAAPGTDEVRRQVVENNCYSGLLGLIGEPTPESPAEPMYWLCEKSYIELEDQVHARELDLYFDAGERRRLAENYKTWQGLPLGRQIERVTSDIGLMMNTLSMLRTVMMHDSLSEIRDQVIAGDLAAITKVWSKSEFTGEPGVHASRRAPTYPFAVIEHVYDGPAREARKEALDGGATPEQADAVHDAMMNRMRQEADDRVAPSSTRYAKQFKAAFAELRAIYNAVYMPARAAYQVNDTVLIQAQRAWYEAQPAVAAKHGLRAADLAYFDER